MMQWGKDLAKPEHGRQTLRSFHIMASHWSLQIVVAAMGYSRVFMMVVLTATQTSFLMVFRAALMLAANDVIFSVR
jgi:hypothetical protein